MIKAALILSISVSLLPSVFAGQCSSLQNVLSLSNVDYVQSGAPDSSLLTVIEDPSTLSEDKFTRLVHPAFPGHSVRVKKAPLCAKEPAKYNFNSYSGYIDMGAKHLFFYFHESRNNPAKDDVILWLDGGPGCSSALSLLSSAGPCTLNLSGEIGFNSYSWNANTSILFVDQPVGVGFSHAEHGETVGTSEQGGKDIATFIAIFFETFGSYKGRKLHVNGVSYGGRYVPVFAAAIYDQNSELVKAGLTPINLNSIMIGNGCSDHYTMIPSYYDMTCTSALIPPVLDVGTCARMKKAIPRCEKWLKEACVDIFDRISCKAATDFCNTEISRPYMSLGKDLYNMTSGCEGSGEELSCMPIVQVIESYLNTPEIQSVLGVDPVTTNFSLCSPAIDTLFSESMDSYHSILPYFTSLLEHGVRTLIYVGRNDWICNFVGNERFTMSLEWSGHEEFSSQPLREWSVDGKKAGMVRSAQGLTYVTLDGAGHGATLDKPNEGLELMRRWLAETDI